MLGKAMAAAHVRQVEHVAGRHGGGGSMACVWEREEGKRREIKRKKIKKDKGYS